MKLGIIGAGFGRVGLFPAFLRIPGCVVREVVPGSRWKEFLKRGELDAVAVAVPPDAQYAIVKHALEQGLHVFTEKPLAPTYRQARELLLLAQKKRLVHGVDFAFPEIPAWKKAKEILDSRAFGAIQHVSVHWVWQSDDLRRGRTSWKQDIARGGGALSFYFSHGLHYLEHFVDEVTSAQTSFFHSKNIPGEIGFDLILGFKNGAKGSVHVSCMSRGRIEHRLIFECERGVLELETRNAIVNGFRLKTYSDAGEKTIRIPDKKGIAGEDERVKVVRVLARRFVRACRGETDMSPSFHEGARIQQLVEMVRASAKKLR